LSGEPALILVSGVLLFIAGLAIVRVQNQSAADWAMLLTLVGWLALFGGLLRMLFPIQLASIVVGFGGSSGVMVVALLVLLLAGVFFSYKGYGRD
jgi:hypothetical protein